METNPNISEKVEHQLPKGISGVLLNASKELHNKLGKLYDKRARNKLSNALLSYRAWYYKNFILGEIVNILELNSCEEYSILNRGCGQGHKFEKVIKLFDKLDLKGNFNGIEPSEGMRELAVKRLCLYEGVEINPGLAQELKLTKESIDLVFDDQMQHHNPENIKKDIIIEANRVLKDGGYLLILDTFEPEPYGSKWKKKFFDFVIKKYEYVEGTGPYYVNKSNETVKILENNGFEIVFNKGYKMGLGHFFRMDLTTQIIAKKKIG